MPQPQFQPSPPPVPSVVVYHGAAPWIVTTNFQGLFKLPEALSIYVLEFWYLLTHLSAYSDEELKRTAELGVGLLLLKHIFRGDLRKRTSCSGCTAFDSNRG